MSKSELVERVARAIQEAAMKFPVNVVYEECARAAILAMREPTAAMLGASMDLGGYDGLWVANAGDVWRAMVDEALAEGTLG